MKNSEKEISKNFRKILKRLENNFRKNATTIYSGMEIKLAKISENFI